MTLPPRYRHPLPQLLGCIRTLLCSIFSSSLPLSLYRVSRPKNSQSDFLVFVLALSPFGLPLITFPAKITFIGVVVHYAATYFGVSLQSTGRAFSPFLVRMNKRRSLVYDSPARLSSLRFLMVSGFNFVGQELTLWQCLLEFP